MTAPTVTALDTLKTGACAASCLLGTETGRCHCRCQGAHHGELLTILVRQTGTPTSPPPNRGTQPRRKGPR